jgi:Rrf2 family nitric oxide-sensitive transcriptional repressor
MCLEWQLPFETALDDAEEAFYRALDGVTLADVSGSRTAESIISLHRDFLSRHVA